MAFLPWAARQCEVAEPEFDSLVEVVNRLLKRERIERETYANRDAARADTCDYIDLFCDSKRRHGSDEQLSRPEYEHRCSERLARV